MDKTTKHKLSAKARIVPKEKRHEFSPEAFSDRNTKVKISIYLDLDVLEFFKGRAQQTRVPYQSQINAELRGVMEQQQDNQESVALKLKQARTLIDTAIRSVEVK
jgi:uncharacterized protein (DUF4415 family)